MRLLVFIFLSILMQEVQAQVSVDSLQKDLGQVQKGDPRHRDFFFKNTGEEKVFILRTPRDRDLTILLSDKEILPDSTVAMRIHYQAPRSGSFEKEIPVYLSSRNQPISLTLTGNIEAAEERIQCPSFDEKGPRSRHRKLAFEARIRVVDSLTSAPLPNSSVSVYRHGQLVGKSNTNPNGWVFPDLTPDLHYLAVNRKGYYHKEGAVYFNRNEDQVVVHLLPKPEPDSGPESVPEDTPSVTKTPDPQPQPVEEEKDTSPPPPDTVRYPDFPEERYAANNVVFLVDKSTSMRGNGKLELLKIAMTELLALLRDIDRISVVAYSSDAEVILPSVPGNEKDQVEKKIRSLSAKGSTAGNKGIRKAYDVAEDHFIDGGNNWVIIATDGAFNNTPGRVMRTISRKAKKGIGISVVGIKNGKWTEESMKEIAERGNGSYVHIDNINKAKHELVERIKNRSRKE